MPSPPTGRPLPPTLDPRARALLESLPQKPALRTLRPEDIRAWPTVVPGAPEPVATVVHRGIPGPAGWLRVRIYHPAGAGPHPAMLWMHGGGWVIGNLEWVDSICRALTARAACVVVSVDYRLAPEAKFPGPFEDAYAALDWLVGAAADLRVDAQRIAVGGESAGGNLAAAITLAARDRRGPSVLFQVLINPVTDAGEDHSPSMAEFADGPIVTHQDMKWFADQYLRGPEDVADPYVSMLRAPDLHGLPPALVVTAGCDPLRDQGEAYAARLREAGVDAVTWRYDGMPHGFLGWQASLDDARRALAEICSDVKRRFATAGP